MAFKTTYRKSGDIRPPLEATIERPEESGNVDLTNADSVELYARDPSGAMEVSGGAATIETASGGEVSYTVSSGELASAGDYDVEWKVLWTGDDTDSERYPKKNYQTVHVSEELS